MAVLGSRGQDRITDLLLGSVASEVVRKSPIPVLLVPLDEDDF
jgi:nucleotide-binding universal stress UspA family protein